MKKSTMSVIQAFSLRGLVDTVNQRNKESNTPILKEDIVSLIHDDGLYSLIYFNLHNS
jgi:hypothetical protein